MPTTNGFGLGKISAARARTALQVGVRVKELGELGRRLLPVIPQGIIVKNGNHIFPQYAFGSSGPWLDSKWDAYATLHIVAP